ncbi:hypothetical protein BDZ45DRAFT_677987 [Acephala macrosclerotiorum]|nr:hypothetical protein BDZ45DRAFT_677987 [Acephala macrosclerotiorum]
MAAFTGTLRGDGLARAQRALAGLEGDPQRLDRERIRFDDSPPPYTSDRSGTTTRSQSPNPPSEEQRLHQQRRMQLAGDREASKPHEQFSAQVEEERRRIWNADPSTSWRSMPPGDTLIKEASEIVKKRWVEQGIWNNKWNQFAYGRWKHEEPLELESESETDSEAGPSPPLFSFSPMPQPKPRQPKSDDEKRWIAERRVIREREREASRPYYQFVYQISKERERIQESENGEGASAADINTTACENVKNAWTKRGIWNKRWGILPGMLWKHEEPLEEEAADGPAPIPANPLVNGSHEAGEASAIRIFGSPSPVESNHHQASGAMNSSQQGPSADIDSAGSENGDAEHSPSAPNSPPLSSGKRVLRPTTGQALRPSERNPSHKDGQPANASLGPIHSSKVSKAAGKRKGPQRRLNISKKVSSNGLPLSSGVDAVESQPSPDRVTPRRSQRISRPVPSVAKDSTRTTSTDPNTRVVRSNPKRNIASNPTTKGSAKPQGISKRPPAKTARVKARGK